MPCMPMRAQLMSQRIAAVRNAASSPISCPSVILTSKNTATMPARLKPTLTRRPVVIETPASSTTKAIGIRNMLGRFVDRTKTGVLPGSLAISLAWKRLSASSYQSPAGSSCR